jgi:hypothetical protein
MMHSASAVGCSVTTLWACPISVASATLDTPLLKSVRTLAAEVHAHVTALQLYVTLDVSGFVTLTNLKVVHRMFFLPHTCFL